MRDRLLQHAGWITAYNNPLENNVFSVRDIHKVMTSDEMSVVPLKITFIEEKYSTCWPICASL